MDQSRPRKIIEGFEDDFEHIKSEFIQRSPQLRLQDFYTFWKESHIDCLFANRFDPRELLEMITEVNKILVHKAVNKEVDIINRLLALYLVLCISGRQPDRLRRRVRTTCEDVVELTRLCADVMRNYSHNDAMTSWMLMLEMNVIEVVEERVLYGPIMLDRRKFSTRSNLEIAKLPALQGPDKDCGLQRIEMILKELECLGQDYDRLRCLLKIDEVNDATVDVESIGTVKDHLDQAKNLLRDYKA